MLFGGQHVFHNLAVQESAEGLHVGGLRVVLVPDGMRESAPAQRQLRANVAWDHGFVCNGALPRLVAVLVEVISVGLNHSKNRLRGTEGRHAVKHGENLEAVDSSGLQAEA